MPLSDDSLFEYLATRMGVSGIDRTTLLFSTGLLDSFSMIDLIMFIEQQSGTRIEPMDVSLDNLDSVERIMAYVSAREQ